MPHDEAVEDVLVDPKALLLHGLQGGAGSVNVSLLAVSRDETLVRLTAGLQSPRLHVKKHLDKWNNVRNVRWGN